MGNIGSFFNEFGPSVQAAVVRKLHSADFVCVLVLRTQTESKATRLGSENRPEFRRRGRMGHRLQSRGATDLNGTWRRGPRAARASHDEGLVQLQARLERSKYDDC